MNFPPGPGAHRNPIETVRYFREITSDPFGLVERRFEAFGDMYYAPLRGTGLYVMRHPDHLDEVLRTKGKSFEKTQSGFAARRIKQLLGDGLVNAEGEHWRRHRRMINPALGRTRIESYAPTIVDYTTQQAQGWKLGQTVDVARGLTSLTLQIVTKVLFDNDAGPHVERVHGAMQAFRDSQGLGMVLPDWMPYGPNKRFDAALVAVNEIIDEMIDDRRKSSERGDDLLSTLVEAVDAEGDGGGLSNEELRDELLTMFFAGHETTSNALVWTLYLLSQNPEIESWVREELPPSEQKIGIESLPGLKRCQAAIEEAMRLFPPVCVISRTAKEDVRIGEFDVTAGSEVLAWFYFTHRDERWFPDPLAYNPQRFLDEPTWPKAAYMPFGAGQRTCIGKHFALMEATLILAELMRQVRLEYVDDRPPDPVLAITLAPRRPMRMRICQV